MGSTTITISESLRGQLVKLAAELQMKIGKKVDYEDVIRYLIKKSQKDPRLLQSACMPTHLSPDEARVELRRGRAEDRRKEGQSCSCSR